MHTTLHLFGGQCVKTCFLSHVCSQLRVHAVLKVNLMGTLLHWSIKCCCSLVVHSTPAISAILFHTLMHAVGDILAASGGACGCDAASNAGLYVVSTAVIHVFHWCGYTQAAACSCTAWAICSCTSRICRVGGLRHCLPVPGQQTVAGTGQ